ncbi:MAG: hypothetical protein ABSA32_00930 [Candidatus Acidiferrales bacterium]|jgi:hypothetical protein
MADAIVESLILDLLEWVAARRRSYAEVMDAWRTSCPKLTVWEDANDRKLVSTESADGRSIVKVTPSGLALLSQSRTSTESALPAVTPRGLTSSESDA